jgi:hypothetical protein
VRAEERAVLGADVSAGELLALRQAAARGLPYAFLRDGEGALRIIPFRGEQMVLGRAPDCDLEIGWDPRVSGIHAQAERRGGQWVVEDDGLSRNGTFINGERLNGQRALRDGDVIQVGDTLLGVGDPEPGGVAATVAANTLPAPRVSEAQRRVLVALCRPFRDGERFATPATNQQIAAELYLSLDAVKSHLRALFARFELEELAPNEKRARLAERALAGGVVRPEELAP